ncbi:hypothetical protein KCU83_g412, partial [Aureobasidium melanogenum]
MNSNIPHDRATSNSEGRSTLAQGLILAWVKCAVYSVKRADPSNVDHLVAGVQSISSAFFFVGSIYRCCSGAESRFLLSFTNFKHLSIL